MSDAADARENPSAGGSSAQTPGKPSRLESLRAIFDSRANLAMFALGAASGLPFSTLAGTLYAWFTAENVDVSTIGILSWAGLAVGFKFLWSPLLSRSSAPLFARLGRRRGWIVFFQILVAMSMFAIALMDPGSQLPLIALLSVLGSFSYATMDIAIDAWRIEIAKNSGHLDLLSTLYQMGFRLAALIGGLGALIFAEHFGWNLTYLIIAGFMAATILGTLYAEESPLSVQAKASGPPQVTLGASLPQGLRALILAPVLIGWAWAAISLFGFMARALLAETAPNARLFTLTTGPWIVAVCVIAPALAGALILTLEKRDLSRLPAWMRAPKAPASAFVDTMYTVLLEPMIDLVKRLRYAAILILILILFYRYADAVWGAFAYPFYLGQDASIGALGHTQTEVAIASKFFGVLMTIAGLALGAAAMLRFGRMPCLVLGAVLAAATNLLFADLAAGGAYTNAFLSFAQLDHVFAAFGFDLRMARLMTAIAGENLALGFASAVYVAYLSSIVNPKYSAVQYALLAALSLLLGALGRGALGEMIEEYGFAYMFVLTALIGGIAVIASIAEYIRLKVTGRLATGAPYLDAPREAEAKA